MRTELPFRVYRPRVDGIGFEPIIADNRNSSTRHKFYASGDFTLSGCFFAPPAVSPFAPPFFFTGPAGFFGLLLVLPRLNIFTPLHFYCVGVTGFEPAFSCSQSKRVTITLHSVGTPPRNRTRSKRFGISCASVTPVTHQLISIAVLPPVI